MPWLLIRAATLAPVSLQLCKEYSSELRGAPTLFGTLVEAAPEAVAGSGEDFVHALAEFVPAGKDASHGRHAWGANACDSPSIQTFEQVPALRLATYSQAFKNMDQVRISLRGRAGTARFNKGGGTVWIASHKQD